MDGCGGTATEVWGRWDGWVGCSGVYSGGRVMRGLGCPRTMATGEEVWLSA